MFKGFGSPLTHISIITVSAVTVIMKIRIPSTRKLRQSGFSLVEMLVAIAVIGVLAGVVIINCFRDVGDYQAMVTRRNAQTIATLASMAQVAGDQSIAGCADVDGAVQKLIDGVSGQGPLQNTTFQISKMNLSEINNATKQLHFANGTLSLK